MNPHGNGKINGNFNDGNYNNSNLFPKGHYSNFSINKKRIYGNYGIHMNDSFDSIGNENEEPFKYDSQHQKIKAETSPNNSAIFLQQTRKEPKAETELTVSVQVKSEPPERLTMSVQRSNIIDQVINELFELQDFEVCLEKCEESLKADPWNLQHLILKSMCFTMLGINPEEANKILDGILSINPLCSSAFYARAIKFYREAEFKDCIDNLSKAIDLNPMRVCMDKADDLSFKAHRLLEVFDVTYTIAQRGAFQEALENLNKVDAIDSATPKIRQKMKDMKNYILKQMNEQMQGSIDQELEEERVHLEFEKKLKAIEKLLDQGKVHESERKFQEICEHAPQTGSLNWIKGYLLYMLGKLEEAIPVLKDFVKTNDKHIKCRNILSKAMKYNNMLQLCFRLHREKRRLETIEIITRMTKVDESNKKLTQAAYLQRAFAKFHTGPVMDASEDLEMYLVIKKEGEIGLEIDENNEN